MLPISKVPLINLLFDGLILLVIYLLLATLTNNGDVLEIARIVIVVVFIVDAINTFNQR